MSRFRIEGDVCFIKCEPGLTPLFQLYDMDRDGTRNYLITVGPYPEDPALEEGDSSSKGAA